MAPKVRNILPRLVFTATAALATVFAPIYFSHAEPEENKIIEENQDVIEAKARLLQELDLRIEERRRRLAREEEALAAMKQALESARNGLEEERNKLEELRKKIEADIARREKLVDERLSQIAKVYASMKSQEAAKAFEGMEDDMALAILERLSGRTVGKIFNLMPKDRVRVLTRLMERGMPPKGD